jgi:hypothetical protein
VRGTLTRIDRAMATPTDEQRRALRLLASIPNGCTGTLMLARGFEPSMLASTSMTFDASSVKNVDLSLGRSEVER